MNFVSTRSIKRQVSFSHALMDCLAPDGGVYVPAYAEDLRPWIMYMDEHTPFNSIAGSLTSALIKEEFSPIISEAIAAQAFPFSPELKRLDENLYVLELFHGPSGTHKDFGISYLAACLEHILLMRESSAVIVAPTSGETGASVVQALKNKKHLKAVLLYPRATMCGIESGDCVWNGGNVYPVEVDGGIQDCINLSRRLYADSDLVKKYRLTLANTVNIGRLLPHTFLYMYAFSRLRKKIYADIYYAMDSGNYGNLAAGLYGWKFSLPVKGFFLDSSPALSCDAQGKCCMPDSIVPLEKRGAADPALPSNIERLEEIFTASPAVMKGLVYTAGVTETDAADAFRHLFTSYRYFADPNSARAYAAARKRRDIADTDDTAIVLIAAAHPCLYSEKMRLWCGEEPPVKKELQRRYKTVVPEKKIPADFNALERILTEISASAE
ncbi:pyridoxal-phosphate dependent enzyme [Treponema sp. OMZ 840]|uniref:pyridoxal-phosphate dependent enzyme n=1 Tax=Treponema sp. OMZ 840 TaxID=244313 RepID=UPI003D928BA3